jgi:hypothetical protein
MNDYRGLWRGSLLGVGGGQYNAIVPARSGGAGHLTVELELELGAGALQLALDMVFD